MSEREPEPICVEVSIACDQWLAACPDAAAVASEAAHAALGGSAVTVRVPVVIGLILTDDAEQRQLNRNWRGKDTPTNVLSFATADPKAMPPPGQAGMPTLLGDVVLAFETVAREAAEQHKSLPDHLRHLVVHGVLHLLGFDHEDGAEAAAMEAREVEILNGLGVPDPYRDTM